MSASETKAVAQRFWKVVWNKRDIEMSHRMQVDNLVSHVFDADYHGKESWRQTTFDPYFSAFPDVTLTVDFVLAEADMCAMRWRATGTHTGPFRGTPPTGKRINVGGAVFYLVEGAKIAEIWSQPDALGLLQQIGLVSL